VDPIDVTDGNYGLDADKFISAILPIVTNYCRDAEDGFEDTYKSITPHQLIMDLAEYSEVMNA